MKDKSNILRLSALVLSAFLLAPVAHAANQTVYNNTTGDLGVRFNPGTNEVGDEVTLGGIYRTITSFAFEYWGTNFPGGLAQARVRFLANDGAAVPGVPGAFLPNSVLFDSGFFLIGETPRATLTFTDFSLSGGNLVAMTGLLPIDFTWTVQFQGLGSGGAGVDLYNPPTVGSSFSDYWDKTGGSWSLRTNNVNPMNFAAQITAATPEPASLWLGLLGGLAILGVKLRNARR